MKLREYIAEIARRAGLEGVVNHDTIVRILCEYKDTACDEAMAANIQRRMGGRPALAAIGAIVDTHETIKQESVIDWMYDAEMFDSLAQPGGPRNWRREMNPAGQEPLG